MGCMGEDSGEGREVEEAAGVVGEVDPALVPLPPILRQRLHPSL